MITIPDLITLIIYYIKKILDYPLRFMESFGSWMHVYAWNKRMEKQNERNRLC